MRVIAGIHKGRQLKPVPGQHTRPTTDKVKEAIFQVIGPFFSDGRVLDLFAGSGGLGIEALSRGMDQAIFVDKHPKSVHTIRENLRHLKLEDRAEVFRTDAFRALKAAAKRELLFNLVLLDPPYGKIDYLELMNELVDNHLLADDAIVYCEHEDSQDLPTEYGPFQAIKQENYGGLINITIYKVNREGA
ncbi:MULTISPECIES: 16S rRNA (guanine(966)-N(2))-methyltransferase RsmD [unclassified Oceanobacillus]|uniref:16S rRNA (guanine(966)-N(2))-methyltransferase RsmD n=1 Tax=unclassified Oceanobacillus TaxID=2630292 RepID=UPI001BE9E07B|nr:MULTISPECIES: 16S rRNA (guanine(966)-N(2))-methyltransferase RsmD [unclassified Oceanobacillus]MBT2598817.1 16S rRNA (guanine(966)-N(2))-methyltransferase RsmD [Oceanobacillus sp. ISL-74]MBT2651736.1 16S rRNA (guanine(966)-N(2))-methyltransferase RsmD [Oceanobacillus sp. ISL-73]